MNTLAVWNPRLQTSPLLKNTKKHDNRIVGIHEKLGITFIPTSVGFVTLVFAL